MGKCQISKSTGAKPLFSDAHDCVALLLKCPIHLWQDATEMPLGILIFASVFSLWL